MTQKRPGSKFIAPDLSGLPPRKLDLLHSFMLDLNWRAALKLAAAWGDLGDEKVAITRGWEAEARPEFYLALGQDPKAHVAAGIEALKRRYPGGVAKNG